MNDSQILSSFEPQPRRPSGAWLENAAPVTTQPARALVFDACHVGVVLRAVLFVESVFGVAAMFGSASFVDWLDRLALLSSGALPASLLWLVAACGLKNGLARLPRRAQYAAGVGLGALAGLGGCAMLAVTQLLTQPPWLASSFAGALLSAGLVAALVWRAKGQTPATTAARLAELQSRIRPHFLFNTLNTAIALVREEPAQAETLLEDLSDLFRYALVDQGDTATLAEELTLARRYLAIEQLRFGERLRVSWKLDDSVGLARLPPLLLQPLVENAVRHGVEPSDSGAELRISTQHRGDTVVIKITNTVPAGPGQPGHGLALDNVRDRLNLLHDVHGVFRTALVRGVYQARIEIPLPGKGAAA